MGRPTKKFVRYHLLDTFKSAIDSDNEESKTQSEFALENKFDTSNFPTSSKQRLLEEEENEEVDTNIDREVHDETDNKLANNESIPVAKRHVKGTSYLESLMLFLKANIGSGVLAMPFGFKNSGLVFGSISLWIMGFICTMCIHVLINCYKHVLSNMSPNSSANSAVNYEEVVYLVAKEKCKLNSRYPRYAKLCISIVSVSVNSKLALPWSWFHT